MTPYRVIDEYLMSLSYGYIRVTCHNNIIVNVDLLYKILITIENQLMNISTFITVKHWTKDSFQECHDNKETCECCQIESKECDAIGYIYIYIYIYKDHILTNI